MDAIQDGLHSTHMHSHSVENDLDHSLDCMINAKSSSLR